MTDQATDDAPGPAPGDDPASEGDRPSGPIGTESAPAVRAVRREGTADEGQGDAPVGEAGGRSTLLSPAVDPPSGSPPSSGRRRPARSESAPSSPSQSSASPVPSSGARTDSGKAVLSGSGEQAVTSGEAFATTWIATDSSDASTDGSTDSEIRPSRPNSTSSTTEAVADPLIGLIVAERYRIIDQLGRGGMGIVYRVEHTRIGKLMAMKLLHGELSTNKEVVRRFKHEALTVSKLSSPHTVQVFDYGVWQHLTYLVMELVEGANLARVLRRGGAMPFERLGPLLVQVCASLAEAHGKGIVHRDIKPENIMIVSDDMGLETAKVLDFGLAKLRESSDLNEVTSQGAVVGTPYFISPEQVLGEDVDGRSDIYSLGAVMFRTLTATYPFSASTPMGMFTKHLTEAPPSSSERAPHLKIPKKVSALVVRCMAKKPEERPQTVEKVREALNGQLRALGLPTYDPVGDEGTEDGAELAPQSTRGERPPRSRRWRGKDRMAASQIATRDEVEAYERTLRRARWGTRLLLGLLVLGTVVGVGIALRMRPDAFHGLEQEPNDLAADANPIPLGSPIEGYIGKRVAEGEGDRDFYAFEVPPGQDGDRHLSLELTALPNLPLCAILYREGFPQPLARFRTGHAAVELLVPTLQVEPGHYFVAVMQDLDRYDLPRAPHIYENVSDMYRLMVDLVERRADGEVEPNDERQAAQLLVSGQRVEGTLAWVADEDWFCASEPIDGDLQWLVEDGVRSPGTVLEVTPVAAGEHGPLIRVHSPTAQPFERSRMPADVNSPWSSDPMGVERAERCVRLRLTVDPWLARKAAERPSPDGTRYVVTLQKLPQEVEPPAE